MRITCPRCLRTLSATPDTGPPAFCMYCGQKLRDSSADPPTVTTPTPDPHPAAADQHTGSYVPSFMEIDGPPGTTLQGQAPTEIGGYRLLKLLGAGGMGAVYEAEHPTTGNRVAVKLLSPRLASSTASIERFRQEGRLASQLVHPRCVFVLAADTDAGRPYIVMELMPGQTLKDLVDARGPLPFEEAVAHTLDVVDGLAEVHLLGMIHRDIKPSNCFLTADGRVKVGDFGLSKSLAGAQSLHLTGSGAFLGTILFASPEQIRGEPLDYASDVYSVCATLYYLLCGEAPFHHDSPTAALAKAISEDPPSICLRRPGVPRDVERVVMRGLERDRDRRWRSLDELREALLAVLPNRQTPARPRALVGAYVLDMLLLSLFILMPLEAVRLGLGWETPTLGGIPVDPLGWALTVAYFALLEGLLGTTAGKALFGLRVSRVGRTGPPGVGPAVVRAVVFALMWFGIEHGLGSTSEGAGVGLWVAIAGLAALLVQWRARWGFRGLHDFASGCHVTQRPQPARQLRPVSEYPNPLDTLLPAPPDPLPETVAGYTVVGRAWADPAGEQVWAAEDQALGREVLLWLRPEHAAERSRSPASEVSRTTRLRRLGSGRVSWAASEFEWTAYAAPTGAPLADTVGPDRPLPWADARFLLEQLVDEFRAAEADGSVPQRLGIGQIWVEPNGRVRVLDFPLSTGSGVEAACPPAPNPLGLLRQVAALALEGFPRSAPGPARAPVPPHAVGMLGRLFTDGPAGYHSLDEFHRNLHETRTHPAEVTPAIRGAQLGIQAAVLAVGLAAMFATSGMVAVVLTQLAALHAAEVEYVLGGLREPDPKAVLGTANAKAATAALKNPEAIKRLEALRDRKRQEFEDRQRELLRPQRFVLSRLEPTVPDMSDAVGSERIQTILDWSVAPESGPPLKRHRAAQSLSPWGTEAIGFWVVLGVMPLCWVIGAAVFRGGLSMALTGLALVRSDGRRAYRRQCAVRTAAVWLPVVALLSASVWLQVYHPEQVHTYAALWLIAVGLMPVYVVVALRYPDRPPQDRLVGTTLVPA
jgi:hypothetical protein